MFSGKRQPYSIPYNPRSLVRGQVLAESPKHFNTRYPRALASITMTVAGTLAQDDQLKVEIKLPALSGGVIAKTVVLASGETATSVAQKIAKALNDDAVLRSYGCYANSALGVVTFYWPGLLGNNVTVVRTILVGVGTITLGNSGALAGGSGPIFPLEDFHFQSNGQLHTFVKNVPKIIGANIVREMALASSPIS